MRRVHFQRFHLFFLYAPFPCRLVPDVAHPLILFTQLQRKLPFPPSLNYVQHFRVLSSFSIDFLLSTSTCKLHAFKLQMTTIHSLPLELLRIILRFGGEAEDRPFGQYPFDSYPFLRTESRVPQLECGSPGSTVRNSLCSARQQCRIFDRGFGEAYDTEAGHLGIRVTPRL